ncbi:hypothetical protein J2X69_003610 [Algoriphagus sp. 4150]|uniref:DUF4625 domain-containing protein n=1 Tax=Algoriphagus sp. 4150 TaxID=2817756 RepID=UPI002860794B|nr:DUF4625 domain-containing protein [Algoriphagus sp. 4150]MDR7131249.1 hypothetical protein [Algoriphagus sp. 4150]
MKNIQLLLVFLFSAILFSCQDDDELIPDELVVSIENLEIGSGNNGKGIIGRDFHLDMDIEVSTRIDEVQVLISQRADASYAKEWSFQIAWDEYKGLKNTNVHKHFTIPADAPEGNYDFIIRVHDENGDTYEEEHSIELVSGASLPVNPEVYSLMVNKVDSGYFYILNRGFMNQGETFAKGDMLNSYVDIQNVKDEGTLYVLIIKKSANHLPETIENIDFSKVIVADVKEHKGMEEVSFFTNYLGLPDNGAPQELEIGAETDNNIPSPNSIGADKAWGNGDYYYGVVYTNTTHNISTHYYLEFEVTGF